MTQISSRTKSIIAGGLVIALVGLAYFLFVSILPAYNAAKGDLTNVKADHERLNNALASVQTFVSSYESQSKDIVKANLALPKKSVDLPNFLTDLQQMSNASGVTLSNLQTSDITPATGQPTLANAIEAVDISLIASANFASLNDFLLRLENSLRLIDVYHITIRADQKGDQSSVPLLQYQIKMYIYYQK